MATLGYSGNQAHGGINYAMPPGFEGWFMNKCLDKGVTPLSAQDAWHNFCNAIQGTNIRPDMPEISQIFTNTPTPTPTPTENAITVIRYFEGIIGIAIAQQQAQAKQLLGMPFSGPVRHMSIPSSSSAGAATVATNELSPAIFFPGMLPDNIFERPGANKVGVAAPGDQIKKLKIGAITKIAEDAPVKKEKEDILGWFTENAQKGRPPLTFGSDEEANGFCANIDTLWNRWPEICTCLNKTQNDNFYEAFRYVLGRNHCMKTQGQILGIILDEEIFDQMKEQRVTLAPTSLSFVVIKMWDQKYKQKEAPNFKKAYAEYQKEALVKSVNKKQWRKKYTSSSSSSSSSAGLPPSGMTKPDNFAPENKVGRNFQKQ